MKEFFKRFFCSHNCYFVEEIKDRDGKPYIVRRCGNCGEWFID